MQKHPRCSHNVMVLPLSHPILLWAVGCFQLSSNAFFAQFFLNSFDMYSPELLILRGFTFLLITNLENVSYFFPMKKIQHFLEKLSIEMTKYLYLVVGVVKKVPHTSKWILSKTAYDLLSRLWNVDFGYFPKVYLLHTSCCSSAHLGRPMVIFYIIFKVPRCKWQSLMCQSSPTSWPCTFSTLVLNAT